MEAWGAVTILPQAEKNTRELQKHRSLTISTAGVHKILTYVTAVCEQVLISCYGRR
jgi:hypothetical protein